MVPESYFAKSMTIVRQVTGNNLFASKMETTQLILLKEVFGMIRRFRLIAGYAVR